MTCEKIMINRLVIAAIIFILFGLTQSAGAGDVTLEARKHMVRGQAAMENARDISDYEDAIMEFSKAIEIQGNWADAWYNLGVAQKSANRYDNAITSFKKYLELNPEAADRTAIEDEIFKLEYLKEKSGKETAKTSENTISVQELSGKWFVREQSGASIIESYYDLVPTDTNSFKLNFKSARTIPDVGGSIVPPERYVSGTINGYQITGEYYTRMLEFDSCDDPGAFSPITGFISENKSHITIIVPEADWISLVTCEWERRGGWTLTFER